jgi:hypothetical protein
LWPEGRKWAALIGRFMVGLGAGKSGFEEAGDFWVLFCDRDVGFKSQN